jgi:probable rRNA maturation factor
VTAPRRDFGPRASGIGQMELRSRARQRSYSSPRPKAQSPKPARAPAPLAVDVSRSVNGWAPARADLAAWAGAALGRRARGSELSVRLVGPRESRTLNARYRRRDKPTNVLSFPAGDGQDARGLTPQPLGDLVICPAVLRAEARAQGKSVRAHWAHLVVHGTLHLVGYDHERARDAARMERREIAVLRELGFDNPYRST